MRLPEPALSRRLAGRLALAAAASLAPLASRADVPTYSLKGIPGLGALTGADAPRPVSELGVLGRGADGVKTGRLNFCDRKGCISSFSPPEDDNYVPPWTYAKDYSSQATSSFSAAREALRREAQLEAGAPEPAPSKSLDTAFAELRRELEALPSSTIIKAENRYLYAEVVDPVTGAIDDVEFLFSLDAPIVGYRSAPRAGGDDKRQRNRIRDLRKALKPLGWKSVGRIVE